MRSDQDVSGEAMRSAAAIDDPRVAEAMQQYLEALEAGRCPSRQEFLAQHPEIAVELGGCLDGLELVHEAARIIRQGEAAGSVLTAEELKLPLGDFRIVREIGRGGMGVVYEAVQLSLGRRVALKVLPLAAALDPKHLQRFKNEAQAAAQLHHSNIVPVYAVGSERGVHYYSMQLIDGYSLADLIEHRRRLLGKAIDLSFAGPSKQPTEKANAAKLPIPKPPKFNDPTAEALVAPPIAAAETLPRGSTLKTASERHVATYFRTAAGLIRQAALALDHAHQAGVIHRDIKPANLLLDERGNVWVTDFGLAQFQANMQLTRTGDMLGTLRYMSPEQASGDRVVLDHRTDIYSLGVTLYELLTLEPAIAGADPQSALRRIAEEEPRPPRALDKHIPLELETIVLKSIAKSPAERYSTAAALADDLQRWLDDQPIHARRPTLVEHAARWSRRHWALVTAAAGLLAVATLGLLLSTIMISMEHADTTAAYQREKQQRDMADRQRANAEENFRQARQAVDTFLELSEEELAAKPSLYQSRRKFLAAALAYYNDFLDQRRNDPAVRDELTKTSARVAQIADELAALERFASFLLLSNRFVQDDIGLSAAQRQGLPELLALAGGNGSRSRPEDLGQLERGQLAEQVQGLEAQIAAVLTVAQVDRLRQLALQQRGPFAFKSPEVAKTLKLTADQRKQINAIIEEESPERRSNLGFGPPPDDRGRGGRPGGPRGFEHGPPPDDYGPDGKKGDPPEFGGPVDFGGPRGKGPGKGPPPPGGGFGEFGDRGPGGPPPGGKFGKGDDRRGGPPPGGGRGGPGFGEPDGHGPGGWPPPEPKGPKGGKSFGPADMGATMKRTVERIVTLLTTEQQAKWKELIGPTFAHELPWRPE